VGSLCHTGVLPADDRHRHRQRVGPVARRFR
jgi:hypothetical protein